MKIIVCPDSFKGSLSAKEAAEAMSAGIRDVFPEVDVVEIPLSDGGEGLVETLSGVMAGEMMECHVAGPLANRKVTARYLLTDDGTAIMEMASASGLTLIPERERNPMLTTTLGTGEMIADAIRHGARRIIIGLGGSSTCDAGMGMLKALGYKFLDDKGNPLEGTGGNLLSVAKIEKGLDLASLGIEMKGICDVDNVLFGKDGAAYVFAPQKGATHEEVRLLDEGLRNYAGIFRSELGVSLENIKGGGAAGGLGAAVAFLSGGRLYSGIRTVLGLMNFESLIMDADLIITGEGCLDRQSLMGKVVSGVLESAKGRGVAVAAIGGIVKDREAIENAGITVKAATPSGMDCATAMKRDMATRNLRMAAAETVSELFMGK